MAQSVRLSVVLLVAFSARPGFAQLPLRDSTAVALRAERLPVLDDDGNVIPEDLIIATMRPSSHNLLRPVVGVLAGLLVFSWASQPQGGAACDIYEPCTPREIWRQDAAGLFGLAVGLMLGSALPDNSINRWKAVEILRAERRAEKTARTP